MLKILLTLLTFVTITNSAIANSQLDGFPGAVPLDHSRGVSTDLVLEDGRVVSPSIAEEIRENLSRILPGGDLSYINPAASTIWDPENKNPINLKPINIDLNKGFDFRTFYPTWIKSLMIEVRQDNNSYLIFASKKAHNILLRKAMLEKLGYRVPDVQWVPKTKISFPTISDKNRFINKFGAGDHSDPGQFVGDANLWITNNHEDSTDIEIQDTIIMNLNEPIYNLALGNFNAPIDVIKGRRTFNSLLIPFAFVDVPESINLFSPKFGREFSGYAVFDYQFSSEFYPTYEDARWISRKLLNLTRKDFAEVAAAAAYPAEETFILTELLIERRNDLGRLFNLPIEMMDANLKVTYGDRLKDGKLIPTFRENGDSELPEALPQPGYAARTAYGEQKSPLTRSEIFGFFRSIMQSNVISNLVSEFNREILPQTNVIKGIQEHQIDNAVEQWGHFLQTGEVKDIEFGAYAIPRFGANLIASRDIVIGNYLGSDENVQLADTIGFSVDGGAYIGFDGIEPPVFLSGGAKVFFNRRYTHLKPIVSIKESLKTPFSNMIVPFFQENLANIFHELESGNTDYLTSEEGFAKVQTMVETFKEQFQDGESLLITDSVGAGLNLRGGYSFNEILSVQADFAANQMTLWRTNIVRRGEEIHIYKDFGLLGAISVKLSLNASRLPIVSMSFRKAKGYARTFFNTVNLEIDENNKMKTLSQIIALKHLLHDNSAEEANMLKKPYKITHRFDESTCNFQFLFWHSKCLNAKDKIKVTYPEGYERNYYRYVDGDRSGRNYQDLFKNVINSLIDEFLETTATFNAVTSGNPGDTFLGRSTTKQFSFETEIESGYPVDMFASILHIKKGWEAKHDKAVDLFNELNDLYKHDFFPSDILSRTEKLQLYSLTLQINFYEDALFNIMDMDQKKFENAIRLHADLGRINDYINTSRGPRNRHNENWIDAWDAARMMEGYRKKMVKAFNRKDIKDFAKYTDKMLSFASIAFNMEGLKLLAGGEYNLFARGQVGGFRKGDEDGDVPYVTDTYGKMGSASFNGPLHGLQNDIKITQSELFIRWIMGYL